MPAAPADPTDPAQPIVALAPLGTRKAFRPLGGQYFEISRLKSRSLSRVFRASRLS
jgi:hypothetical protein